MKSIFILILLFSTTAFASAIDDALASYTDTKVIEDISIDGMPMLTNVTPMAICSVLGYKVVKSKTVKKIKFALKSEVRYVYLQSNGQASQYEEYSFVCNNDGGCTYDFHDTVTCAR